MGLIAFRIYMTNFFTWVAKITLYGYVYRTVCLSIMLDRNNVVIRLLD